MFLWSLQRKDQSRLEIGPSFSEDSHNVLCLSARRASSGDGNDLGALQVERDHSCLSLTASGQKHELLLPFMCFKKTGCRKRQLQASSLPYFWVLLQTLFFGVDFGD